MEKQIDVKVLKYIPKSLHKLVTACDRYERYPSGYGYNVIFDDEQESSIFADSVEGLRWACKAYQNGQRGVIYG